MKTVCFEFRESKTVCCFHRGQKAAKRREIYSAEWLNLPVVKGVDAQVDLNISQMASCPKCVNQILV